MGLAWPAVPCLDGAVNQRSRRSANLFHWQIWIFVVATTGPPQLPTTKISVSGSMTSQVSLVSVCRLAPLKRPKQICFTMERRHLTPKTEFIKTIYYIPLVTTSYLHNICFIAWPTFVKMRMIEMKGLENISMGSILYSLSGLWLPTLQIILHFSLLLLL